MHAVEHAESPLLLSIKQAAVALGISDRTVWTLVQTRQLPHLRVGRRLLFSRAALETWIAQQELAASGAGGG